MIPDYGDWRGWLPAIIALAIITVILLAIAALANATVKRLTALDRRYLTRQARLPKRSTAATEAADGQERLALIARYERVVRYCWSSIIAVVAVDLAATVLLLLATPWTYVAATGVMLGALLLLWRLWRKPTYQRAAVR